MTNAQIAQVTAAVIAALAIKPTKAATKRTTKPVKSARPTKDQFLAALIAACAKQGFADPQPNVNVLTYDRWIAQGRKVRAGEKSIVVSGRKSGLFYISQTDVIG